MKIPKILFLLCFFGALPKAQAYITYLNGRIDHALYDGHDPKLVVAGKISHIKKRETTNKEGQAIMMWEGPEIVEIDFDIASVIMGDGKFVGQKLKIPVSSFTWPQDGVKQDTGVFCILILRENKNDDPHFQIEVVVPAVKSEALIKTQHYLTVKDNKSATKFLEDELLKVLKTKLRACEIRETLLLLGPILQKENIGAIEKWTEYKNDWVIRTALACIVYASPSERHLKYLARNIDAYFKDHPDQKSMLTASDDFKDHSAHYVYYKYVFFLDPKDRNFGSKWDDNEEIRNKATTQKLKATGLISKAVCKKLAF